MREVMTKNPVCVAKDTTIAEAAKRMRDFNAGALVIEDNGQVRGIVTDRDIAVRGVAGGEDRETVESRAFNDSFEIEQVGIERTVGIFAVGEAEPAGVESHDLVVFGEPFEEFAEARHLPLDLEVA